MQHDEIIDCPKSGGNLCYKIEVSKDITNYFSLSCGFWTNSLMTPDSDFFKDQMGLLPELYKDLAWLDNKTGLVWIPNHTNVPDLGMVFADGTGIDEWAWAAVKAIPLGKDDKKLSILSQNINELLMDSDRFRENVEEAVINALEPSMRILDDYEYYYTVNYYIDKIDEIRVSDNVWGDFTYDLFT